MDELTIKTFVLGDLLNNCYLIFNKRSRKAILIDAPPINNGFSDFIDKERLEISFIALTHAHFDHIGSLNRLAAPFYVHKSELDFLSDAKLNGSSFFSMPLIVKREALTYEEGVPLSFESHRIDVIDTPGHTPGSVSLRLNNWLFSGDALFFNSIGRTDIPLASEETLIKSIKEKLFKLPPETIVYPGHGPATTIGREKELNPFLQ